MTSVVLAETVGITGDYRYHVMLDFRLSQQCCYRFKCGTGWDSGYHWGLQVPCNARFQTVTTVLL